MDEGKMFAVCFKYVVIGVVAIIVACIGSCQASKYQILKAIEAGASPLEAKCALDGGDPSQQSGASACLLLYGNESRRQQQAQ